MRVNQPRRRSVIVYGRRVTVRRHLAAEPSRVALTNAPDAALARVGK